MFFWKFLNYGKKGHSINSDIEKIMSSCAVMESSISRLTKGVDNLNVDKLLRRIDKLEEVFNLKLAEKEYQIELSTLVKEDYKRIINEMQEKLTFCEAENEKLVEALQKLGINL